MYSLFWELMRSNDIPFAFTGASSYPSMTIRLGRDISALNIRDGMTS
jgi:hypothetical protein